MEEAIHTPNCPIWDVNFRPMLPVHAQPRVQQQQPNQSVAQQAPNLAAVVAGKAVTPSVAMSGAIVKKEPCESMAEAEEMEVDQPHEHPSAASVRSQVKEEPSLKGDTAGMTTAADPQGAICIDRSDFDLSKDLILEICRDLDDTQFSGDKDVRIKKSCILF